jgi:hypothetical protein
VTYGFTSGGWDWPMEGTWMPGTSPGTTPLRRLETIPGISTHLANAGVQRRPWLPRSLSVMPGEATKLRFAPTSRPSTSFYVERSVLPARSSDRVFRGPTTSPRVPRPADKGRGCPGQARARRRSGHWKPFPGYRRILQTRECNGDRAPTLSLRHGRASARSLRHGRARRRSFASRRRPGHPRPSTSRGCMLQARSSDRVFQRPTTSPRVPRPADKRRGCPGHRREAKLVASPGQDAGDSLADTALKSQLAA